MLGEGNTHTGINVWSRSSWSCSRKLRSASPDMLLQTWPGRRGGGASRSRVRVLCNTLTDRGRTRGKENDRLCDFLTSQTLFPLTLHVIIPEERLQKARLRLSHEKLIICHMLLDISSILLLLILQNESRCLWACWQTMYTEMLLRSHCVEESQTALIDLLMSHFLTETRKNF